VVAEPGLYPCLCGEIDGIAVPKDNYGESVRLCGKYKIVDIIIPQGAKRNDRAGKHQRDGSLLPETAIACKKDDHQKDRGDCQNIKGISDKNDHGGKYRTAEKQQEMSEPFFGNFEQMRHGKHDKPPGKKDGGIMQGFH
jgi:hypothetical protein